jgi:hypothetical protein
VAGFDETGLRGAGGPAWVHVARAHPLCCAHAGRELRAAAEQAPARNGWHWATQAADALVAIQHLRTDTTTDTTDTTDAAAGVADPDERAARVADRDTQLPVHSRRTRPGLLRHPRPARRGPPRDARTSPT